MAEKKLIAADIGAGSGRLFVGAFSGSALRVAEGARFLHKPVSVGRDVYWNFLHIWDSICSGMERIGQEHGAIASIGFDSFAPDSGFFDGYGRLLSNPLSYRTVLGSGILKSVLEKTPARELFAYTGLQSAEILLLPQLMYLLATNRKWLLEKGTLLPLASGLACLLTGRACMDFTVASISMLWDASRSRFSGDLIRRYLGADGFLPELAENQSALAKIRPSFGMDGYQNTLVMNSGIHDTAVAAFALELKAKGQLCMNCGTWTALAVVVEKPVTNDAAFALGLTNYGLPDGRYMLGKVTLGLFYLQRCREEWARRGVELSYAELSRLAGEARGFQADLDDPLFSGTEESVLARVERYFTERGQTPPATAGEFARCILQSLAVRCRKVIAAIETATGVSYAGIYMGGGGVKDAVLCRLLREETGKEVRPVAAEVTVMGNLLSQLIGQGDIRAHEAGALLEETEWA